MEKFLLLLILAAPLVASQTNAAQNLDGSLTEEEFNAKYDEVLLNKKKQLANTKKNFTEFGVTLVKTSDLLKEKEKTVESLKGQLQDSENKFNKCEQILFNATEEIESLKQNKKSVESAVKELERNLTEKQQRLKSANNQITEKEEFAASLEEEVKEMQLNLTECTERVDKSGLEIEELEQQNKAYYEKLETLEANFAEQGNNLTKANNEIKLLNEMVGTINCRKAQQLSLTRLESGVYYFHPNGFPWTEANNFCSENGMHLAIFETEQEMKKVAAALPNQNQAHYWVGASGIGQTQGHFAWVDGKNVDRAFWESGYPESTRESCVDLKTPVGKLHNHPCTSNDFFICELASQDICY